MNGIVENLVQCWSCEIFDRLFRVVSAAGAAVYEEMTGWAIVALVAFWAAYVMYVVMKQLVKGGDDFTYQKSVRPVFIHSLVVAAFLSMGTAIPRFASMISFEPAAAVSLTYADVVLQTDTDAVNKKVDYEIKPMADDGFFRPALRDKVIDLMKTTIVQFQNMIKLGLAVMDRAFSLDALFNLAEHILMFAAGAYLAFAFFKLFIKFCFYFIDVIVNLAMFAFFFPFALVFFVFKNAESAAGWVKSIGGAFSPELIKNVIASIVSLVAAVMTYTISMMVIAKFFSANPDIANAVITGNISADMLKGGVGVGIIGCIILAYLINFLTGEIKSVSDSIFDEFHVKPASPLGEDVGKNVEGAVGNVIKGGEKIVETIMKEK
ncbi:MAG: hypothetical protein LBL46_04930 [Rickettsiales bacterium]|jgi:hypothetical protein|nr:hypothetical protein [Rickettsiales bacterium]